MSSALSDPALVVPLRRGRAAPVVAFVLALLGGALMLADSPAERLVGGACAATFGLTALLLLLRHRGHGPALVLDDQGLTDTASGAAAGFLPWSAVTGLAEQRTRGHRYLSVSVADPNAVLARVDHGARAAMQANLVMLGTPVNIPLRPLAIGVAELTREFARRTEVAVPAALTARLPAGTAPRPPATEADLADLASRAAAAGVPLPPPFLSLLAEQDGWTRDGVQVFASRPAPEVDGVVEANLEWRALAGAATVSGEHVLLARDNAYRYTWCATSTRFHVLARSDHRSITQLSTFGNLIVAALRDFPNPLG